MMTIRTRRVTKAAIGLVGLTLALAACSSTGGAQGATQSGAGTGVAKTPRLTIAMITHEAPGDTFWDKIRAGAQAAAAKDNIDLKYSADPDAIKQATLINSAVASHVDGIATTLVTPDALAGAVKNAEAKGIPVVGFNSGIDQYKQLGALMYFGSDESLAGQTVGEKLAAEGDKHPLCVIQAQGSVALEARCAGVKDKIPGTENIDVDGTDDASVKATLQAKLAQDPSIDSIVTLGAPFALDAVQSVQTAGSKAKVVTFDLNADVAKDIQSGSVDFAVDQQPYVEGYLAVDSLWLYLTNGDDVGGGKPVLTGPSIVDKSNIDKIAKYAADGTR